MGRRREWFKRTGIVGRIGKIGVPCRASDPGNPEGTAAESFLEARDVSVVLQATVFELGREVASIDAIFV